MTRGICIDTEPAENLSVPIGKCITGDEVNIHLDIEAVLCIQQLRGCQPGWTGGHGG